MHFSRPFLTVLRLLQWLGLLVSLYQTGITIAGTARRKARTGHLPDVPRTAEAPSFGLIVCARNEQAVVGAIVKDLLNQEYRGEAHVIVVAHNCSDETAAVARALGAEVVQLETLRSGKVQAIRAGMEALDGRYAWAGVFDADARVPTDFLEHVAAATRGRDCLQVESSPRDSYSWIAAGYGLGRRARNVFWWRPREALGLGTTINGSGFFIRPEVARELLPSLKTVTEDLEMTARLYASGRSIGYVSTTRVRLQEPGRLRPLVRQRTRWARGHFGVIRYAWIPLARQAARGDVRAFDLALYLLVPTRLLTRTAVTLSFASACVRAPWRISLAWTGLGFVGEWGVTFVIAVRERLVPRNRHGIVLAARHSVLGMLWFPIGAWALLTSWRTGWAPTPRNAAEQQTAEELAVAI